MKMGPTGCPKTSVTNYQSTLRNTPEERKPSCLESFKNAGLKKNGEDRLDRPCENELGDWKRVKKESDILYTAKLERANWNCDFLRGNCLLKHVTEGKIGWVTERRERRRQQLLDGLNETRGYCELKEEALDRTIQRTGFEKSYKPS